MKFFNKKIFFVIILSFIFFSFFKVTFAVNFEFDSQKDSFGIGEEFYFDLLVNTEGLNINTVSGKIILPDDISLIRIEDGKSIIKMWVEPPVYNTNTINFSGLIPNGFSGVIDPFNSDDKLPGLIIRLVLKANKVGLFRISSSSLSSNLNDGVGTELILPPVDKTINIENFISQSKYENKNIDDNPELNAYIIRDPNIFNNKYVLIFNAFDKETGIKDVMVKEGRRDWQKVRSPYLLKDQNRRSTIYVRAVNFSGVSISQTIESLPYNIFSTKNIVLFIIILLMTTIRIYFYKKNKKKDDES